MNTSASTVELRPLLLELAEQFGREICGRVLEFARERGGREVLGTVAGREITEDVYRGIDRECQEIFWQTCQEFVSRGLRIRIISEHALEEHQHQPENPNVICYLDPFDGTDQFAKGIWEAWYSVFSFTTMDNQPLAGGCIDLIAGILYIADAGNKVVKRTYLETGETSIVSPSSATELSGESVVASYKGKWRYLMPWILMVSGHFAQERFRGITHYSWGGSFVYALLAAGVIEVYIMPGEPTDEIRPGRAFADAANLYLCSVTQGGVLRLFTWSQKRRVTFFVAAANEQLARSVVGGIWGTRDEGQDRKGFTARVKRKVSNVFSRPRIGRLFLVSR